MIPLEEIISRMEKKNGREKIFIAFLEFIKDTPYEKIKVSDLIKKAGVNRSTFYRYYTDIRDYYNKICDTGYYYILLDIDTCFEDISDLEKCLQAAEKIILGRVEDSQAVIRLLTGKNGSCIFFNKFPYYFIDTIDKICRKKGVYDIIDNMTFRNALNLICMQSITLTLGTADLSPLEKSGFVYDARKNIMDNVSDLALGKSDETGASILFTLGKLAVRKGTKFCSVNSIMKYAGVSRTQFYNYFSNMDSAVVRGVACASMVVGQIIAATSLSKADDIKSIVTPEDYGNTFAGEEEIISLLEHCDHFYFFLAWCYGYTTQTLYRLQTEKNGSLTPKKKRAVDVYAAGVLAELLHFAQTKNKIESINNIIKEKQLLEQALNG